MNHSIILRRAALVVAAVLLLGSTALGQESEPDSLAKTSLSFVPSNSAAFLYVDVVEMMNTPGMELPKELMAEITEEANEQFRRHLGLQVCDLVDATYVLPDSVFSGAMGFSSPGFGLFAFSSPLDRELIEKSLPSSQWRIFTTKGRKIYLNDSQDLAIFISSPNTLAFGPKKAVRWFYKNRRNHSETGVRPLMKHKAGHVTFACNTETIPDEFKSSAPAEFKELTEMKTFVFNLDLTDGVAVNAKAEFASSDAAAEAAMLVKLKTYEGLEKLENWEAEMSSVLDAGTPSMTFALQPLAQLAVSRYGQKILGQTTVQQEEGQVAASIAVEGFDAHMMSVVCLAAIQSIGTSAEEKFEEVAAELNEK